MGMVWAGFAVFAVVSTWVGLSLLRLWARTRELPELLIGVGVLGIGPVGFGILTIGEALMGSSPQAGRTLLGLGSLSLSIGAASKYAFNWRVYHPESKWVLALISSAVTLTFASFVYDLTSNGFTLHREESPTYLVRNGVQIGCLLWGSIEALRYWRIMRRRLEIGLADPVVCNRFLLWGVGAGAAGVGSAVATVCVVWTGTPDSQLPGVLASSSLHGLTAAVAMGLAFVPPRAYTDWVKRRFEQKAQAAA